MPIAGMAAIGNINVHLSSECKKNLSMLSGWCIDRFCL